MGMAQSKQYLELGRMPILVHTLRVFENATSISHIFVVVPREDFDYVKDDIIAEYELTKIKKIIPGGTERQDSVKNGLDCVTDEDIVIIHDGVRPFVSEELINKCVTEAYAKGAVSLGVPAKDTIKSVDAARHVLTTYDRRTMWLTQTPQAFKKDIITEAYRKAYSDGFIGTDDASLVERARVDVTMIHGSYDNIKITTPDDLTLGEILLKKRESTQ
jgi:2-C-methyl-D-erythritol 4-phosphate cytidylyltransferase